MKGQKDYQKETSDDQALKMSNSGRGRGRSASRGRGRGRQSKELVECFKCTSLGIITMNVLIGKQTMQNTKKKKCC
jgi:hypothetical protein